MRLVDVPENAVLAQDIFWQRKRLISKGSVLTKSILDLVHRRNIEYIYITKMREEVKETFASASTHMKKQDLSKELDILNAIVTPSVEESPALSPEEIYNNQYLRALAELNTEVRYGRVLANREDIDIVRKLFVSIMQDEQYRAYLNKLDNKDHYTYLHAIDVFTLCVLFMRKQGMQEYVKFGVGFLLHDVGKLKTPKSLLKKQGKLTKPEFELLKRHTVDGYGILSQIGSEKVAYLALSHHERVDGSGYPQRLKLMQLPIEVRILQLMDIYSAITLPRVYRHAKSVTEAIRLLFQEKYLVDEGMLYQLVDFLGIYPEQSLVLLSDGSHATVEKVNEQYPLLPAVRIFQTGEQLTLPIDFQLTVQKLLTYHVETPDELFYKFSDYLINSDEKGMEMYYAKLKEHYKAFEWFTHLYIPAFQIFRVLQEQKVITDLAIERGNRQLATLLEQTIKQLRQIHEQINYALIVVDPEAVHENAVALLEGMLHTEGVYALVVPSTNMQELHNYLQHGQFSKLIAVGEQDLSVLRLESKMDTYQLTGESLEKMLFHLSSIRPMQVHVLTELERHRFTQSLIKQA